MAWCHVQTYSSIIVSRPQIKIMLKSNNLRIIEPVCSKPWWRHQMETFSALLAICRGNSPVPGEFPHKGQWRGALMFSLICASIDGCVNNREAGDLNRHRAHYDVIRMPPDWYFPVQMLVRHKEMVWHFILICDCCQNFTWYICHFSQKYLSIEIRYMFNDNILNGCAILVRLV